MVGLLLVALLLLASASPMSKATTTNVVEYANAVVRAPTSLSAQWTVPPSPPSSDGQTILLFDSISNCGSTQDYLQAVLQWKSGAWTIYPQWTTGFCITITQGPSVPVSSGDSIQGLLSLDSTSGLWTVSVSDLTTGQSPSLTPPQALKVGSVVYPAVLQVVSVQSCSDYPASSVAFSSIRLLNDSLPISPMWNPSVGVNDGCGENVVISSSSSVSLFWGRIFAGIVSSAYSVVSTEVTTT